MKLYNTLTKTIEEFVPQNPPEVTMYTCGPTVYDYPHVGNWFTFIRYDLLVRTLKATNLKPKWVMNITDVGHLVSDADEGEDKLEKGAKRENKSAWDIAKFYGDYFTEGLRRLNISKPDYLPKATEHIEEQLKLVEKLEEKGYTYVISDGVYFDTSKFSKYADFAQLDLDEQQAGARVEINPEKRNPTDFALWKFSPKNQARDMEWWAPWQRQDETSNEMHVVGFTRDTHSSAMQGADEQRTEPYVTYGEGAAETATQQSAESTVSVDSSAGQQDGAVRGSWGFPGWHLECSAMSMKYLGETLDIHSGGIDHIPVHHTNEIAQSEAVTGKPFANYWMHANHISVNGEKISKSLGNSITLEDIENKGFSLEAFRLHVLESHYRSQSKFSWESLEAAQNRLRRWQAIADQRWQVIQASKLIENPPVDEEPDDLINNHPQADLARNTVEAFSTSLASDLDTPSALATIERLFSAVERDGMTVFYLQDFTRLLQCVDDNLGIYLFSEDITGEQKTLVEQRERARTNQDWAKSDEIRDELLKQGIGLRDTPNGAIWNRL